MLRDNLGAPIKPFPKDKPFARNVRANGDPLDRSQWRGIVSDLLGKYEFGPKAGPLSIVGSIVDQDNLSVLVRELQEMGWIANLIPEDSEVLRLMVHHPDDPDLPA